MLKQLDDSRLNSTESVNQNLQPPQKNQSPPRLLLQNRESSICLKDTDNSLFLFSFETTNFQDFKLLQDDRVLMIGMVRAIA